MRIEVQLEGSPLRRLFCVGEKPSSGTQGGYLEDFSENPLAFAAISGSAMHGTNELVAFLFQLSS